MLFERVCLSFCFIFKSVLNYSFVVEYVHKKKASEKYTKLFDAGDIQQAHKFIVKKNQSSTITISYVGSGD